MILRATAAEIVREMAMNCKKLGVDGAVEPLMQVAASIEREDATISDYLLGRAMERMDRREKEEKERGELAAKCDHEWFSTPISGPDLGAGAWCFKCKTGRGIMEVDKVTFLMRKETTDQKCKSPIHLQHCPRFDWSDPENDGPMPKCLNEMRPK